MTHTKGEWNQFAAHERNASLKGDNNYRSIEAGKGFLDDDNTGFHVTGFISESDTKLIAAAPRLLEALEKINHTLMVHGKIDANTDLHELVSVTIKKATT